ncbi:MAG TPA: tRNA pseudouridine(38-40) synthase TruA [Phycisphaerales bacterium]|nr:tRNA pseudouridine(38-40) synthase TruA [Phycisphaerales bacterium]
MARYRLTIAYDGTDFHGWQKQEPPAEGPLGAHILERPTGEPGVGAERAAPTGGAPERARVVMRTVQEVVERAAREVMNYPVTIIGASRTDAGVHAEFQTAAFTVPDAEGEAHRGPPIDRMAAAINSRLPDDVLVLAAARVVDDFDPTMDCVAKGYCYSVHVSRERPLWDRKYVYHCRQALDAAKMNEAARVLVGTHDFAAFTAAGHGRGSTERTVIACSVERVPEERVEIRVAGDGFLWNMVRIIAGTLIEVGRGHRTAEDVREAIASKDRTKAGTTMPPEGLCLKWAYYVGDPVPAPPVAAGVTIPRELIERAVKSKEERRARREEMDERDE